MADARLEGKVALVIGGGQTPGETIGNGRAISLLFARHGASVVVVDRKIDRAEATVDALTAEGGSGLAVGGDVTRSADCAAMVDATIDAFGSLDVLVNNVGIGGADGGPVSLEEDVWDRIQEVNDKAATCVIRMQSLDVAPEVPTVEVLLRISPCVAVLEDGGVPNLSSFICLCMVGTDLTTDNFAMNSAYTQAMRQAASMAKSAFLDQFILSMMPQS